MLRSRFVYVQVTRGQASALVVSTGLRASVAASAFDHPRTLMGDYAGVRAAFTGLLRDLELRAWYRRKPWALVHLPQSQEGGLTNVELRAFREAMLEAGCEQVFLLGDQSPALSEQQLLEVQNTVGKSVPLSG